MFRLKKGRISGVTLLDLIYDWIWPKNRCRRASVGVNGLIDRWGPEFMHADLSNTSLGRIHRAPDGRFILVDSAVASRANSMSNSSSSDDGGFLPRHGINSRMPWRRPLVGYPSQLSLRSDGSGQSSRAGSGGLSAFLGVLGTLTQPRFHHHATTLIPTIYTPGVHHGTPKFQSSSPAVSGALSPWTPVYFSDISSVRQPSSAERSFPTPPGYLQLRNVHQRYSQELPSLSAIHEETRGSNEGFIPVRPEQRLIRVPPPYPLIPNSAYLGPAFRPRAKLFPRHARIARSAPELANHYMQETSPESHSSSSGFGSKNTSQQNQSSRSGSSSEWKLPPYRPPPPPPPPPSLTPSLPMVGQWLEYTSRLHQETSPMSGDSLVHHKAVDVGSVDGHYEFDPATPTPTPSTPTGPRDDSMQTRDTDTFISRKTIGTLRNTRYDNIEARVQAMKQEFNEFRKRQAKRRRSQELESAC